MRSLATLASPAHALTPAERRRIVPLAGLYRVLGPTRALGRGRQQRRRTLTTIPRHSGPPPGEFPARCNMRPGGSRSKYLGSPYAQLGASRAKTFGAITEPVVLFVVFTVALITGTDLPYAPAVGLALLATIFAYYAGAQVRGEHYPRRATGLARSRLRRARRR